MTPTLEQLRDLLARVEGATGDRGVDDLISRIDPKYSAMRIHPYIDGTLIDDANIGRLHTTPFYRTSLDAALALTERVLGDDVRIELNRGARYSCATLLKDYGKRTRFLSPPVERSDPEVALVLTAATLKAVIAEREGQDA